jgi:hypothetical protein
LTKELQDAVVRSRLTRWRDMFMVNRIIEGEVRRFVEWGQLIDPLTLRPCVSPDEFMLLLERCLEKVGEERRLPDEVVEAAIQRAAVKL